MPAHSCTIVAENATSLASMWYWWCERARLVSCVYTVIAPTHDHALAPSRTHLAAVLACLLRRLVQDVEDEWLLTG